MPIQLTIEEFAAQSGVETTVIRQFIEIGLIAPRRERNQDCLTADDMVYAWQLIRLHRDLGINAEGIEVILSMRQQLATLRRELAAERYKNQQLEREKSLLFIELPQRSGLIIDSDEVK